MHAWPSLLVNEYPPERMPAWLLVLLFLALVLVPWAAMWKIFEKAEQAGWKSLVPFYNVYTLLKIVDRPRWWFFLFLLPLVNFVFFAIVNVDLAHAFERSFGFALGLCCAPFIFLPLLAFGPAEYQYLPG